MNFLHDITGKSCKKDLYFWKTCAIIVKKQETPRNSAVGIARVAYSSGGFGSMVAARSSTVSYVTPLVDVEEVSDFLVVSLNSKEIQGEWD